MSATPARVTFDSQCFTYLVKANAGDYDPSADPDGAVGEQALAAFRIFLHYDIITVLPTVMSEIRGIQDPDKREAHEMFQRVHLVEVPLDHQKVTALATYYQLLHPGEKRLADCQVVAEAELHRIDFLLTFDAEMMSHLSGKTGYVILTSPAWFWRFMRVAHGSQPKWVPHYSHPLAQATWWRW